MESDRPTPTSGPRTVVVTSRSFGSGDADPAGELSARGFSVVRCGTRHEPEELAGPLRDAVAWIAGTGPIGERQLELAPSLRLVARYGVGVDAVDRQALARRGIALTNTPGANTAAVADHAVGLLLAALRATLPAERAMRQGQPPPPPGRELGSCTVGIVGFGAIGREVHRRVAAFGATVLAHDPYLDGRETPVPLLDLDELARRSNVLSLHAPPGSAPIIDARLLALLPRGAVLVNTARAELVDEAALAAALRDGHVGAVATDVVSAEHGQGSPLLTAPNVTITPHVAGHTVEAIDRMGMSAAREVVRVCEEGRPPAHPVATSDDQEGTT